MMPEILLRGTGRGLACDCLRSGQLQAMPRFRSPQGVPDDLEQPWRQPCPSIQPSGPAGRSSCEGVALPEPEPPHCHGAPGPKRQKACKGQSIPFPAEPLFTEPGGEVHFRGGQIDQKPATGAGQSAQTQAKGLSFTNFSTTVFRGEPHVNDRYYAHKDISSQLQYITLISIRYLLFLQEYYRLNRRRKFPVVCSAISSMLTPRNCARYSATCRTQAG
jgi:hypothetical protein